MNNIEQLERIPKLLVGYLRGDLTETEKKELYDWVNANETNREFFQQATDESTLQERLKQFTSYDVEAALGKATGQLDTGTTKKGGGAITSFKKLAIAACLLVIAATAGYFLWIKKDTNGKEIVAAADPVDVQAGAEKATLTLSDGRQIMLDSTSNGTIAQQGNILLVKEDGSLAYSTDQQTASGDIQYNTLSTPKGGEFRSLKLSDGTKVWLNSVSSIRYPISFVGNERKVEVTGEVYFEVAPDKSKPFRVTSGNMEVEVLGTHFNINTYNDEGAGIATTLLEGSVKVINAGRDKILKPGQQARIIDNKETEIVDNVDTDVVVAWKNGSFVYGGASIRKIMQDISRWYNVEVVFKNEIKGEFVLMGISRSVPLSRLLAAMEKMGDVHFELNGKTIVVKQ